jgi:hypothetical protein
MSSMTQKGKVTKQSRSVWGKLAGSVLGYIIGGPVGSAAGSTILGNVFHKGGSVKLIDPDYFGKKGRGKRGGGVPAYKKGGLVKGSAEAKAYMHVGFSHLRLDYDRMPAHKEVYDFAEQLAEKSGYKIIDESPEMRS